MSRLAGSHRTDLSFREESREAQSGGARQTAAAWLGIFSMEPLLEVRDLAVQFDSKSGCPVPVLRGVSFEVRRGEVVGLLGESGCGKTTMALAVLRLLPPAARLAGGS